MVKKKFTPTGLEFLSDELVLNQEVFLLSRAGYSQLDSLSLMEKLLSWLLQWWMNLPVSFLLSSDDGLTHTCFEIKKITAIKHNVQLNWIMICLSIYKRKISTLQSRVRDNFVYTFVHVFSVWNWEIYFALFLWLSWMTDRHCCSVLTVIPEWGNDYCITTLHEKKCEWILNWTNSLVASWLPKSKIFKLC